jgi:hypothetical protein
MFLSIAKTKSTLTTVTILFIVLAIALVVLKQLVPFISTEEILVAQPREIDLTDIRQPVINP